MAHTYSAPESALVESSIGGLTEVERARFDAVSKNLKSSGPTHKRDELSYYGILVSSVLGDPRLQHILPEDNQLESPIVTLRERIAANIVNSAIRSFLRDMLWGSITRFEEGDIYNVGPGKGRVQQAAISKEGNSYDLWDHVRKSPSELFTYVAYSLEQKIQKATAEEVDAYMPQSQKEGRTM